ncbi:MAG: helix-turn-helix domain-containing protein [Robiginitomaculum sp.]
MPEEITHTAPITVTVAQVCELTGLSKSSIYRLFYNGKLTRRKLGGKTLILMSELRELLETLPEAA